MGSKQIRPNNDYQLSVLAQGFKSPENIRLTINGTEVNGRIYVDSRDVVINGDSAQTIVFNVSRFKYFIDLDNDEVICDFHRPEIFSMDGTNSTLKVSTT